MLKKITGCGTALVTPFNNDLSLDEKSLVDIIEFQIAEGIDFLVPCGTTGESATTTVEEHLRIIELTIKTSSKRVPVIGGAGGNNTNEAIHLAKEAEKLGADGILSVTPYYNRPTQEGLYEHFKAIAEAISIPVVLYNVPSRTSCNMLPETVARLSKIDNVIALKAASNNLGQIAETVAQVPENFSIVSGDDANTLPIIAVGGSGLISVTSNQIPKQMTEYVHLCLDNNLTEARAKFKTLLPLMQANFFEVNPIPVKAGLAMMGKIQENYRLPLTPMASENKARLKAVLKSLDLV